MSTEIISFLGAGNMAAAMIDGLLRQDPACGSRIRCMGGGGGSASRLAARTGVMSVSSLEALTAGADLLVVAFKPKHLALADPSLVQLTEGRLVISVLAGKTLAQLAKVFPHARNIVRTMPNTPSRIGAGITGWSAQQRLAPADLALMLKILLALGQEIEIPEEQMDALTAVSGSGPAYLFEFAAALREAGIQAGLARDIATRISVATLAGAGKLLESSPMDAEELRRQVTSPNGVTHAGLEAMKRGNFRGVISATVQSAKARAGELSREA